MRVSAHSPGNEAVEADAYEMSMKRGTTEGRPVDRRFSRAWAAALTVIVLAAVPFAATCGAFEGSQNRGMNATMLFQADDQGEMNAQRMP